MWWTSRLGFEPGRETTWPNGRKILARRHFEGEPGRRATAKLLTKDEARRVAAPMAPSEHPPAIESRSRARTSAVHRIRPPAAASRSRRRAAPQLHQKIVRLALPLADLAHWRLAGPHPRGRLPATSEIPPLRESLEGALCRTSGGRRFGSHPQIIEKFGRRFNTRDE
jgi:hypothetical protein